jgi:hypothetical protein
VTGWDEDDEYSLWWWAAVGYAELLIETTSAARGPRERAGRDTAALLIYHAAIQHRCRPGLVRLATLRRLLDSPHLADRLQADLLSPPHRHARECLAAVDLTAGLALLAEAVAAMLPGRPGATVVEELWPGGTLLRRGGGGPTW